MSRVPPIVRNVINRANTRITPVGIRELGTARNDKEAKELAKNANNRFWNTSPFAANHNSLPKLSEESKKTFLNKLTAEVGNLLFSSDHVFLPKTQNDSNKERLSKWLEDLKSNQFLARFFPQTESTNINLSASVPVNSIPAWYYAQLSISALATQENSAQGYRNRSKQGIPMLQKSTVKYYEKEGFNTQNCKPIFTTSSHEILHILVDKTMDKKKDEIIMTVPTFGLFFYALHDRGFKINLATLTPESDYKITPAILETSLRNSPNATLFVFINPDNPTGKSYSKEELKELAEVFKRHNEARKADHKPLLIVFSDEVSKNLSLKKDGTPAASIGSIPGMEEFTLTVGSGSKTIAPAASLAYGIGPTKLVEEMLSSKEDVLAADCGPSQPIQYAMSQALNAKAEKYEKFCHELSVTYRDNLLTMINLVKNLDVEMKKKFSPKADNFFQILTMPDGGLQCLIQTRGFLGFTLPDGKVINDDVAFAKYIRDTTGVTILPGSSCGYMGTDMIFRLTISKKPEKLKDAAERIGNCCLQLKPSEITPRFANSPEDFIWEYQQKEFENALIQNGDVIKYEMRLIPSWEKVLNKLYQEYLPETNEEVDRSFAAKLEEEIDKNNININEFNEEGTTLTRFIVKNNMYQTIEMLINKGVRIESQKQVVPELNHITPHIKDYELSLGEKDRDSVNKLNQQRDQNFAKNLEKMLDSGNINLNAVNINGETLLDLAARNGLVETTKMLLNRGIEFPIMKQGTQNSPLFKSAQNTVERFKETYSNCAELPNILANYSYQKSVADKVIRTPEITGNDSEEKKHHLLNEKIFATNLTVAPEKEVKEFREKLTNGADINKSNAQFLTNGDKYFLQKSVHVGVETKYGTDMFWILENGHYEAKREFLNRDIKGKVGIAIEFDPNLSDKRFLNRAGKSVPDFDVSLPENTTFLKSHARMCGVLHVLGEPDRNMENFFINETNGKPVKIDNSFVVNYQRYPFGNLYESQGIHAQSRNLDYPFEQVTYNIEPTTRFGIYGSAQSRDFLVCILGGEKYENMQKHIDEAKTDFISNESHKHLSKTDSLVKFANSFTSAWNNGLDDKMFKKIIANISKPENKHLEKAFMSFMSGISDAINLGKDEEFLKAYSEKYRSEGGEKAGILAKQFKEFFQENVKTAEQQFAPLLTHFNNLVVRPEYGEYQAADFEKLPQTPTTSPTTPTTLPPAPPRIHLMQ